MIISFFSIVFAIFLLTVVSFIMPIVRKKTLDSHQFSLTPLLLILFLSIIRVFFPIEFPFSKVINIWHIYPSIISFFYFPLFTIKSFEITILTAVLSIWIIVAISKIVVKFIKYRNFNHSLRLLSTCNDKKIHAMFSLITNNTQKKYVIIQNELITSPAITGFFSPTILLPNIDFTDDELQGILIHEWNHFKYRHTLIKLLFQVIQDIFWWNPALKILNTEVNHMLEMSADKQVCKVLSHKKRSYYLSAIVKVLEKNKFNPPNYMVASLVEESSSERMHQRFQMIIENRYGKRYFKDFFLLIFIFIMFTMSYYALPQAAALPTADDLGAMDYIPSDAYIIKEKEIYKIYGPNHQLISESPIIVDGMSNLKIYNSEEDVK
ncbi:MULTISPECIES: M56 family metallopeptidase [unclassified Enterococcus]|uniref:M56 family metallopeptidase n=1 Tax=unclassified Enterococcus TaxID=2608891 RepID=UPI0024736C38|nr:MULTISPECIES: M56 family metallopeptidase [unclassified Enterococcus]